MDTDPDNHRRDFRRKGVIAVFVITSMFVAFRGFSIGMFLLFLLASAAIAWLIHSWFETRDYNRQHRIGGMKRISWATDNYNPTAGQYPETSLQETDSEFWRGKGSIETRHARLLLLGYGVQFGVSLAYGMGLFFIYSWNPEITQWLTQHLAVVTNPVVPLLPVTRYAATLAYGMNVPTALIQHVFSILMLANGVLGIAWFGLCKKFAADYKRSLDARPRAVENSNKAYLFIFGLSSCFLFILPLLGALTPPNKHIWDLSATPLSLYFLTCISPTVFFFNLLQVVAIRWAYAMTKANPKDQSASSG